MHTITNERGTKGVNICTDGTGTVRANYGQFHVDQFSGRVEMQVFISKSFATIKNAERWAAKVLA